MCPHNSIQFSIFFFPHFRLNSGNQNDSFSFNAFSINLRLNHNVFFSKQSCALKNTRKKLNERLIDRSASKNIMCTLPLETYNFILNEDNRECKTIPLLLIYLL